MFDRSSAIGLHVNIRRGTWIYRYIIQPPFFPPDRWYLTANAFFPSSRSFSAIPYCRVPSCLWILYGVSRENWNSRYGKALDLSPCTGVTSLLKWLLVKTPDGSWYQGLVLSSKINVSQVLSDQFNRLFGILRTGKLEQDETKATEDVQFKIMDHCYHCTSEVLISFLVVVVQESFIFFEVMKTYRDKE